MFLLIIIAEGFEWHFLLVLLSNLGSNLLIQITTSVGTFDVCHWHASWSKMPPSWLTSNFVFQITYNNGKEEDLIAKKIVIIEEKEADTED